MYGESYLWSRVGFLFVCFFLALLADFSHVLHKLCAVGCIDDGFYSTYLCYSRNKVARKGVYYYCVCVVNSQCCYVYQRPLSSSQEKRCRMFFCMHGLLLLYVEYAHSTGWLSLSLLLC